MLNFYRRFIQGAAESQTRLISVLKGPRLTGKAPVKWTQELEADFRNCKESLSKAALLAHPDPTAELAVTTEIKL